MVPVGSVLPHAEPVLEGLARVDPVEAQARHAIHRRGQDHAVPVDRGGLGQLVGDAQAHRVALAPAQLRRRQRAVHDRGAPGAAGEIDRQLADRQVELGAGEDLRTASVARGPCGAPQTGAGRAEGEALHEPASGES